MFLRALCRFVQLRQISTMDVITMIAQTKSCQNIVITMPKGEHTHYCAQPLPKPTNSGFSTPSIPISKTCRSDPSLVESPDVWLKRSTPYRCTMWLSTADSCCEKLHFRTSSELSVKKLLDNRTKTRM